jgi:outer membrane protein OmpA-like peptidoglycan-associated protein
MRFWLAAFFGITITSLLHAQGVELKSACFNTPYDDFAARQYGGTIYVLSAAINACDEQDMDEFAKKPFSDLYVVDSCKLKQATILSASEKSQMMLSTCYYDGPVSSNAANDILFFTNNQGSDKNQKLTIHYSVKNAKGEWTAPVAFAYNNDAYNTTHPYFDDKSNTLYFASDMPGGQGGMDIYKCTFQDGKFGPKESLRIVNTDKNDVFPAFQNGKLYFSSQGHQSTGGYDLFVVENLEVKSMGTSFNSTFDDLAIFFTTEKQGFLTSNRATNGATDDIYTFVIKENFVDIPLAYVVKDVQFGVALEGVAVRVVDDSTGIVLYEGTTDALGGLSQVLDSMLIGDNVRIKVSLDKEGYSSKEVLFTLTAKDSTKINVSDLVNLDLEPLLQDMEITALLGLKSIYYDFDKADLRPDAIIELDKVVRFMNKHSNIEVELGSHTDCRGAAIYNQDLSDRRAKNAAIYIQSRISNPSRITYKGYGEAQLRVDCPCEGGELSQCSEQENQLNRRTEFVIRGLNISTGSDKVQPKGGVQGGTMNFKVDGGAQPDYRLDGISNEVGVHFRVQVESSKMQIPNPTTFYKREDVYEYELDGYYKYCLGSAVKSIDEAIALQNQLRNAGYTGAFVVAFNNTTRITLDIARKLLLGQ